MAARGARGAGNRVEQHEVVDRAAAAHLGHGHAGLGELARGGLALVAERVVLAVDDQGRGQPAQLAGGGLQR
jgi:hypothetical protein